MMILRIATRNTVLAVELCYGSAAVLQHAVIGLDGAMMRQQVQHTAGPSANPAKDCYPCRLSRGKIQGGQIACKVHVQNHTLQAKTAHRCPSLYDLLLDMINGHSGYAHGAARGSQSWPGSVMLSLTLCMAGQHLRPHRAQLAEMKWLLWFCCFAEINHALLHSTPQLDQRQD